MALIFYRAGGRIRVDKAIRGALLIACIAAAWLPAGAGSVSYTYDALGRLTKALYNSGTSTTTITYSYDAAGNRTTVITTSP